MSPIALTGLETQQSFTLAPGATSAPTAEADPNAKTGSQSDWVQVQNETPFDLTVLIGPDEWAVTSAQASTLPLPGDGAAITLTAVASASALSTVTATVTM